MVIANTTRVKELIQKVRRQVKLLLLDIDEPNKQHLIIIQRYYNCLSIIMKQNVFFNEFENKCKDFFFILIAGKIVC